MLQNTKSLSSRAERNFFAKKTVSLAGIVSAIILAFLLATFWLSFSTEESPPSDATVEISVLTDKAFSLALHDIVDPSKQSEFKPAAENLNFGYSRAAVWVKISIRSVRDTDKILAISPNFLDTVNIFVAGPGEGKGVNEFTHYRVGDHENLLMNEFTGLDTAVKATVETGKATIVYIHIANTNSVTQLSVRLLDVAGRGHSILVKSLIFGVWLGAMAALVITQLVFFFFDRKAQYPLLAFSTLGVILIYFGNLGLSHVFLFRGDGAANDAFIGINAWGGLSASAMAYLSILNIKKYAPRMRWFYYFTILAGIVGVGFALMGHTATFGPFGSLLGIVGAMITLILSVRLANTEGMASQMRAAAFCVMGLGAIFAMLQRLGLEFLPNWTTLVHGG